MKKELLRSKVFLAGAGLFVAGSSPLLIYILYELAAGRSGGNPIGLGLLFFVSFWPSVVLMAAGAALAARRARRGGGNP